MKERSIEIGPLNAYIDPSGCSLRRVGMDGECLVYRVFAALRDERWATPEPKIRLVDESPSRYEFESDYSTAGFGMTATTVFEFEPTSVRIRYVALVHEQLHRNRLGLCALLPATLAGSPFLVRGDDERETRLTFPEEIAPRQPCTDIRELEFAAGDHVVTMRFSGDSFEMEDQRNWTDFSFKVYCTPLSAPRPVRLEAGDRVEQSIEIAIEPRGSSHRSSLSDSPSGAQTGGAPGDYSGTTTDCRVPHIGTRRIPGGEPVRPVDYYRVDSPDPRDLALLKAYPIHSYLWERGDRKSGDGSQITCLGEADPLTAAIRSPGGGEDASPPRGLVGTDGAFAELNRERPVVSAGETVVFTICPQVHDGDDEVLLDNLFGIRAVLGSAKRLYPDRDIGIGLVELTPHFNPAAGDRATNEAHRESDERLRDGFAPAWGFAAICELAAAGVSFATLFDDYGPHGFSNAGSTVPAARLLHDVPSGRPVTVTLPAARVGSDRRYLMRIGEDLSRGTRRGFLAANLGETDWIVTPESLLGEGDAASGNTRWSVDLITRSARPSAGPVKDIVNPEYVIGSDQAVSLPPVSYAKLMEVS